MTTHRRRHEPSRLPDNAEEGYYLAQLVKDGPIVPCMITCGMRWRATICGMWMGAEFDPVKAPHVLSICNYGKRITEAEYEAAMADPITAQLDPFSPVDVRALPAEEF